MSDNPYAKNYGLSPGTGDAKQGEALQEHSLSQWGDDIKKPGVLSQPSGNPGDAKKPAPPPVFDIERGLREGLRVMISEIPGLTPKGIIHPEGFLLQCPPLEQVEYDFAFSYNDYDTVGGVQMTRANTKQLRQVTFDTLFVDMADQPWLVYSAATPIEHYTKALIDLCESGRPFMLTLAHQLPPHGFAEWNLTMVGPEAQFPACLRALKVSEKAGEGDARYVNVQFYEYRDPLVNRWGKGTRRKGTPKLPTHVTLWRDGTCVDAAGNKIGKPPKIPATLALLARYFYHDSSRWQAIARANHLRSWGAHDQLVDRYRQRLRTQQSVKLAIPVNPKTKPSKDDKHVIRGLTEVAGAYRG